MMRATAKRDEFKGYLVQMKGEISAQLSVLKLSTHIFIIFPL